MPPVQPMLAKSVKGIPDPAKFDDGLSFEPKWDGFRCIVFKDGDEVELTSRNTKPLTRYFPEVVAAIREQLPERCVLDGELFVADRAAGCEFEVLQERIHPAESRINMLAEKTPGLASWPSTCWRSATSPWSTSPFSERRARLEEQELGGLTGPTYLTRTTTDAGGGRGLVRAVRGRRARRRGGQAAGRAVPAERAHDAQDQARAHRRRGAGRLPAAQDLDARSGRCSARCCSACTPTASSSTSGSPPRSPRPGAPS